ncbi:unnamed protein product, partial [Symbiodinium microadriaticum]
VGRYMESYVQSYGDAALIFAAHDGYSQLVTGLLLNKAGKARVSWRSFFTDPVTLSGPRSRGIKSNRGALFVTGRDAPNSSGILKGCWDVDIAERPFSSLRRLWARLCLLYWKREAKRLLPQTALQLFTGGTR